MTNSELVTKLIEFSADYGFMLVFAVVSLVVMIGSISRFIKRWETTSKIKSDEDSNKTKIELELMQKRTNAEIEQSLKMFNLVTEVQTSQVAQMQSITEVINLLKDEIRASRNEVDDAGERLTLLNSHVSTMMSRYEQTMDAIPKITSNIEGLYNNDVNILNKLDIIVKILDTQIRLSNSTNQHIALPTVLNE